jgi:hypothetical protein
VFVLVGSGIFFYGLRSMWTYWRSAGWDRVEVKIESAELKTRRGSDSTTHSVECRYTYEVDGVCHEGTRVGIVGGSSSQYDLHRRRHEVLKGHAETGEPFLAYVDPDDPENAILFRESGIWLHAMMPFGLIFWGAGAAAGAVGSRIGRVKQLGRIAKAPSAGRWRERADWSRFRVLPSTKWDLTVAWAFGAGPFLFAVMFLVTALDDASFPSAGKWAIAAVLAGSLVLVARAVVLTLGHLVHGSPELVLNEIPMRPGERMVAVLKTSKRPLDRSRTRLRLRCNRHYISETATEGSYSSSKAFEKKFSPAEGAIDEDGASLVPVVVDVPRLHLEPEKERSGVGRIVGRFRRRERELMYEGGGSSTIYEWVLRVRAGSVVAPLRASFVLPVFEVDESKVERRPQGLL